MLKRFVFLPLLFLAAWACQGNLHAPPAAQQINPTGNELQEVPSVTLAESSRSATLAQAAEACDGDDNNGNAFVDEGCFGCRTNAIRGDFDGDGKLSELDAAAPLLVSVARTQLINSDSNCLDLTADGVIDLSDSIAVLNLVP